MKLELALLLLRHGLTAAGTLLVSRGLFSDADLANASHSTEALLGALATLYGLGWSAYRKWKRAEPVAAAAQAIDLPKPTPRDHTLMSLLLLGVLVLPGCMSVPKTRIAFDPSTGTLDVRSPKEIEIIDLKAERKIDGTVSVSIGSYEAKNNAAIIDAVAQQNIGMVEAVGAQGRAALQEAVAAAKKLK